MDDMEKYTTIVFECNAKKFEKNFFKVESEFGKPVGVSMGNLMSAIQRLEDLLVEEANK